MAGSGAARRCRGVLLRSAVAFSVLCQAALAAEPAYGPVNPNETLWSVARKVNAEQRAGTTAQMAWALYQANPDAFEGSPGKIKAGASLTIPDKSAVRATAAAQAYALLTGQAPAPPAASASSAPAIEGLELQPAMPGETRQGLAVIGTDFLPGATLEFLDVAKQRRTAGRKPLTVTSSRIEYAARFPQQTSRWQVVVRNPDGARSAPYEFDGGASVTLVLAPPVPVPVPAPAVVPLVAEPPPAAVAFVKTQEHQAALAMIEAGQRADAVYKLLAPLDEQYAGDVEFDYLLGTSAFDSGRFSEAILILQRAVAARPGFAGARMELARSYYALGDNESARREFETLQKQDPPPEAARVIAEYLAAIDQRAVAYEPDYATYVELASGYDSNANGAPDIQTFLGFTLDSRNQATASTYYGLGLGAGGSYPLSPSWRVLGNGQAAWRSNPDASFVDSQVARVAGGLEWTPGMFTVTALPGFTYAMLDGEENHQNIGADVSAAYPFAAAQASVNLRYAQQRYTGVLETLDVDTLIFGVALQTVLGSRLRLAAAVTAGSEEPVQTGSAFGRDLQGARIAAIVDLYRGHSVMLSAASLSSDFDSGFLPGTTRSDDQVSAALAYDWGAVRATGWTARAQVGYVDNSSSVALYDYDRFDAGLSVRKEFK
jgi:FimV-like protein